MNNEERDQLLDEMRKDIKTLLTKVHHLEGQASVLGFLSGIVGSLATMGTAAIAYFRHTQT